MPGAGVEPARDYSQRILSPTESISPDLTKRDEPIFTGLAAVKVMLRPVRSTVQDVVILASLVARVALLRSRHILSIANVGPSQVRFFPHFSRVR